MAQLTDAERQVLVYTVPCYSARAVAAAIGVPLRTVERLRARAVKKLEARNTAHAVAIAESTGVISGDEIRRAWFETVAEQRLSKVPLFALNERTVDFLLERFPSHALLFVKRDALRYERARAAAESLTLIGRNVPDPAIWFDDPNPLLHDHVPTLVLVGAQSESELPPVVKAARCTAFYWGLSNSVREHCEAVRDLLIARHGIGRMMRKEISVGDLQSAVEAVRVARSTAAKYGHT